MMSSGSLSRGMTRSSERRNSATPTRSTARVERHVDAGHQDERALAAADLAAPLHLFLERLQAAHRAGDRVLRPAQVEVDDLEEFAGALGDFGDERREPRRRAGRSATAGSPPAGSWTGPARRAARCRASSTRGETPSPARLPARRCRSRRPARCTRRRSGRRRSHPSTNAPCSRISATCAAATVAIATWVNCVRYSTPSGWW